MAAPITVVWYTDPHNIWCWGFEPTVRRLETVYPEAVRIEVRQGGLFEDFSPVREQWARMSGGRWTETVRAFFEAVSAQHRMPMDAAAMTSSVDDFTSTWPACLAAKAADLQGREPGRRYLRSLREAWCLDGRPIHRREVQEAVAAETGLDVSAFRSALDDGAAEGAFLWDRDACKDQGITGFPTFEVLHGDDKVRDTVRLDGWQPWETFDELLRKIDPDLRPRAIAPTDDAVLDLFRPGGRIATRELAAVLGGTDDDAEVVLEKLEEHGRVVRRAVGNGIIWELPQMSRAQAGPARVAGSD